MPKIRGIKPDYWTDEDIVELSIAARLLFIGMWNFACDNGHLDDKPKQLKMRILPGDDVSVDKLLSELVDNGRIERAGGTITILKFAIHQKPHSRWWTTCDAPGCTKPDGSTTVVAPLPTGAHNGGPTVDNGEPREKTAVVDGDGDGDGELMVNNAAARKRAHQLPDTWQPNDAHLSLAAENRVDIDREVAKFRDHYRATGKAMKDWDATFRNWLRNSAQWRGTQPAPKPAYELPNVRDLEQHPDVISDDEWQARQVVR